MTPTTTVGTTTVELRYFAAARAALGRSGEALTVPPGTTVGDVVARLSASTPAAAPVLARCSVLLDGRRAAPSDVVPDGAGLDLLPPFAGG
ncbi:MoaD/ThiS family protein [Isoptericola sp. NEAU-Y5]|uniref:MoaD/ThiS family protein n=1 Tax=Isoptericola luteus TaxID=2879484 RepID=A0ABS7ZLD9_9MICO|nr:MoaD/ThiS family protein [Isoptericola sp. NEAU-Y5]MCA5895176.1 MoaD/ThiS family protein [Isoptericola sp. NEAU-Y5]